MSLTRIARSKNGAKTLSLTEAALEHNSILRHAREEEAARIVEVSGLVEMPTRYMIYDAGETISQVYFPIDCVLSVVTEMEAGEAIEVGTVGREGMSGIPLLMGGTTTANSCYCQVPGQAVEMPIAHFHHLLANDATFRAPLNRYLQAYVNFLGQLTGCNRLHSVYERCARWLLLSQDRVEKDDIALTHEYLAMMLGSRRSGVTIALAALQNAGFIRYVHGHITIVNRAGLEEVTCECYAVAQKQFAELLSPAIP